MSFWNPNWGKRSVYKTESEMKGLGRANNVTLVIVCLLSRGGRMT